MSGDFVKQGFGFRKADCVRTALGVGQLQEPEHKLDILLACGLEEILKARNKIELIKGGGVRRKESSIQLSREKRRESCELS